jgi:acylpyruvate hydrolase
MQSGKATAMRLVSFKTSQTDPLRCGIQYDGTIADVQVMADLAGLALPNRGTSVRALLSDSLGLLRQLEEGAHALPEQLRAASALHPVSAVTIGPPVPDPSKIICLGLNYEDHAKEAGLTPPSVPMFFAKFANSLVGPADAIIPPRMTDQVDYEAELAVVIGKQGRDIPVDRALEHVIGAMAFNDVSARDLQMANNLWTGGKAIDTFGPCGPALVTLDEITDLQSLAVRTRVNGQTVQDGNTASMIFGVAETIAFLSQIMTLEPGDIIATGTPAGVGNSRDPKLFLHAGDIVEVEIEGVGTLRNPVGKALISDGK